MSSDCVRLVREIKKLLEKASYRDQGDLDAEQKQTWIEDITSVSK